MAASSSATANSVYDVFIGHRGPDVKKTFASHIYRSIGSYGLRVFLDQPELQPGDYITSQIEGAIQSASVHVAIFSTGYAESTWCFDELVQLLESNSPIIPVFYHVKPAELRWTRGKEGGYAKALEKLEKKTTFDPETSEVKLRYHSSTIKNWRNALSHVAGISGFDLKACNGHLYSCGLEINAPLSIIPKSTGTLKHLERIVIGHESLRKELQPSFTKLPEEFCLLQSLKSLEILCCSELKSLPECFGKLTNLRHIRLHWCEALERQPYSIGNLTNLQEISQIGWNALERLPESLGNLTTLQQIELQCQGLKRLPDSLGSLTNLQRINLIHWTALDMLPDSLGNLTNLQQILLVECRALKRLPDYLGNLTKLQRISTRECSAVERLPGSFCKLTKLQHLDLRGCFNITMSSETLGNISTLEYIYLTGCTKIEIPPQLAHQRSLKQLFLNGTNLKELPYAVGDLRDLEVLRIGSPLLDMLPPSPCELNNLKELILIKCKQLKCLPDSLGELKNLKQLVICDCKALTCLPASLGLLTQLTELRVQDCPLLCHCLLKWRLKDIWTAAYFQCSNGRWFMEQGYQRLHLVKVFAAPFEI